LHNNAVTIIPRDIPGVCKRGDILISSRSLNLIGILDPEKEKLIWSWGPGTLDKQHHPTLLKNGHILIFDNGTDRGFSRILELDPVTKTIVWQYEADPPDSFFSKVRGSAQRLPNGNTLITDSDSGRVFEVTKEGETVWDFYNPDKKENGKRYSIYRMMRITDPYDYPKLRNLIQ